MKFKLFLLLILFNGMCYAGDKIEVKIISIRPFSEGVDLYCDSINSPVKNECSSLIIETRKSNEYNEVEGLTKSGKTLYLKVDAKYNIKENEIVLIDNIEE